MTQSVVVQAASDVHIDNEDDVIVQSQDTQARARAVEGSDRRDLSQRATIATVVDSSENHLRAGELKMIAW